MNLLQSKPPPVDPYRIFFPIGCAFAVWGAFLWLAFDGGLTAYPGPAHADIMIGGFLLSFAIGFLLTAVPRFTGTPRVTPREMWLVGWPLALEALSEAGLFGVGLRPVIDHASIACALLLLFGVLALRFARRRQEPPPTFPIAGVGVGAGALGAVLWAVSDQGGSMSSTGALGRVLLLHAFMPALVLGIGGRLIPLLNGRLSTPPTPADSRKERSLALVAAVVFVAGFPVEALLSPIGGRLMAALPVTFIALRFWGLHRVPPRKGVQSLAIWVAAWCFALGFWGAALLPTYAVPMLHLTFISGLGLMTLAIATRVALSHGGFDLAAEQTSRALLGAGILILLSMVVRVIAGVAPFAYFHELALAAALWIAGLVLWSTRFLPAVWRVRSAA